jgi:hypothetical protein
MGDEKAHKRKALHNEAFLSLIQRNDSGPNFVYPDWMLTAAFYTALHYVDAKLAILTPPIHPSNHSDRNMYVSTNLPKDIANNYLFLKSKSEYARYFPDSETRISQTMVNICVNLALTKFV